MDNGIFILIIVALAGVVVWQASKLKQYRHFDRLLPRYQRPVDTQVQTRTAADPAESATAVKTVKPVPRSRNESPPEGHIEEAKRVQMIMARCRYAEFYIDQLDDDYEREQFLGIVQESIDLSQGIDDPLLEATALEPLILLLDKAGEEQLRDELLRRVQDAGVKSRIDGALASEDTVRS